MRFMLFVMFFLLLGAFFIISVNNLALKTPGNSEVFLVKYIGWFPKVLSNIVSLTGSAIKLSWMP